MHMAFVPQGFQFPSKLSIKHLLQLWFHGDEIRFIRPYRLINPKVDLKGTQQKVLFTKAAHMESIATGDRLFPPSIEHFNKWDLAMKEIANKAFASMIAQLYPVTELTEPALKRRKLQGGHQRPEEVCYTTIYNRIF